MTTKIEDFELYALIEIKRVAGRLGFLPPCMEAHIADKLGEWFTYRTEKVMHDEPKAQKRKSALGKVEVTELESSNSSYMIEINAEGNTWVSDKDKLSDLQDELTDVVISTVARYGHFKIAIKTISFGKEL